MSFGVVSLVVGLVQPGDRWRQRFLAASALALGAVATMVVFFAVIGADRLLIGPPRLWPVALSAATIVLALPVLAGTLASAILRRPH